MSSIEDNDIAQGITTLWAATSAVTTAVPGGLHNGRGKAGLTMPYAEIDVKQGPTGAETGWMTGGRYLDFRHVTLTIRGLKAGVSTALAAVRALFDHEVSLGRFTNLAPPNSLSVRIRPISIDDLHQDPEKQQGEDIWIGTAEYEILTTRARP